MISERKTLCVGALFPVLATALVSVQLQQAEVAAGLSQFMQLQYFAEVKIGTPPQTFTMLVDTGSANLWLPSADCYSVNCWVHNTYDHSLSSTYEANNTAISMSYESGSCSGVLSRDTLALAGLQVKEFTFAEMRVVSRQFLHAHFDGILGLGWQALAVEGVTPLVQSMFQQGLIAKDCFSLVFSPNHKLLVLGGDYPESFTPPLVYHPIAKPGQWVLALTTLFIGELEMSLTDSYAVIDTGAAGIYGDSELISTIQKQISIASDCSNLSSQPYFGVSLSGTKYPLSAAYYISQYVLDNTAVCESPFAPLPAPFACQHFIVLGAPFLKAYYAHFDFALQEIAFALAT